MLAAELPAEWKGLRAVEDRSAAERFTAEWRDVLRRHRLLGLTWPEELGGRGLRRLHQVALVEELVRSGLPAGLPGDTFGLKMLGNTLLRWGTDAQQRRFLPPLLSGEERWCQGLSEPGAGSDLASVRTRAVLDGDTWVVDGQKAWTSSARQADWMFLLARTDPRAPKQQGLSFLLLPLRQPGMEVRPIRQLTGDSDFNEVFLTSARTAATIVVGPIHGGWSVAKSLLGCERGEEAATNPILFRAELDGLVKAARGRGRTADPLIRQRLAWCYGRVEMEMMRWRGLRVLNSWLDGAEPGVESSVAKLFWSEYHQTVTELAVDVLGMEALVPTGRGPHRAYRADDPGLRDTSGAWVGVFLNAREGTIYAGASEVQRDVLAESVLRLPKDPRPSA